MIHRKIYIEPITIFQSRNVFCVSIGGNCTQYYEPNHSILCQVSFREQYKLLCSLTSSVINYMKWSSFVASSLTWWIWLYNLGSSSTNMEGRQSLQWTLSICIKLMYTLMSCYSITYIEWISLNRRFCRIICQHWSMVSFQWVCQRYPTKIVWLGNSCQHM